MSDKATGVQLADALDRMRQKAEKDGCRITSAKPGMCVVTSARPDVQAAQGGYIVILAPGPLHGCDCRGYETFGYCKHYALALAGADWLPVDPGDTWELTDAGRETLATMGAADRRAAAAADLAARQDPDEADVLRRMDEGAARRGRAGRSAEPIRS